MRYQFYREHKYVSAALNDLERLIAKTDFRDPKETVLVTNGFRVLSEMLQSHAQYENEQLHTLLENKHSKVHEHVGEDHLNQYEQILEIQNLIEEINRSQGEEDLVSLGYKLHLTYRKFVADNLCHLHKEETKILPELQRLYTDEELKQVEVKTYRIMTVDEIVQMMQVLFPHMNPGDREAVLSDIYDAEPEKFAIAWKTIAPSLKEGEQASLFQRFEMAKLL